MKQMSPRELDAYLKGGATPVLLDVREPREFEICRIEGAQLMPMNSVPARLEELDPAAEIVCICHHGGRSAQVAMFLASRGFGNVINLAGGVDGWAREVDPAMARY